MTSKGDSGKLQEGDVQGLRSAAAEVSRDLRRLTSRVAELTAAVELLEPPGSDRRGGGSSEATSAQAPSRPRLEEMLVTVRPLPELAMVAMAETSLRGLPGVDQVLSVERSEDRARFKLEIIEGTDLVAEMRAALPVAFRVTESIPGAISLEMKWIWGTVQ